jgi:hypothetical protein
LKIDGSFGLFSGIGFSIKYIKENVSLYHLLASDEYPSYAYKESDRLIHRLELPCNDVKIQWSEIPDSTKKHIIHGCVEFNSEPYFASEGFAEGREILPRKKLRSNMRIYFKSAYLDMKQQ